MDPSPGGGAASGGAVRKFYCSAEIKRRQPWAREIFGATPYGLPKNEISKTVARNVAALLLTLSSVKFEKEEEPIRPRPPEGRRADG